MTQNFHVLSKITAEPPALPPLEHASAHILNAPIFERKYARVYLGDPESRDAVELRKQIAKGAREALEEQYWDIMERTIQAHPAEARLGGDPGVANKVRAFVAVRHYRSGEWEDRIEVCGVKRIVMDAFLLTVAFSLLPDSQSGRSFSTLYGRVICKKPWTKPCHNVPLLNDEKPVS